MTRIQTATPCRGKCDGGHKCNCNSGHLAPHICSNPDCRCHAPSNYGLTLDGRGHYVRENQPPAGVRVLEVPR